MKRVQAGDRLACALLALAVAAAFLVMHPYRGISGDALIYVTREWAGRGDAPLARDMLFLHDTQTSFSLFGIMLRGLLQILPVDKAAFAMASVGILLWMGGAGLFCQALAYRLRPERPHGLALAMAAFIAVAPLTYSMNLAFAAGEYLAVPRPFAEAFVLVAMAAVLHGRIAAAIGALGMAVLFHPLVGLGGAGFLFVFHTLGSRHLLVWGMVAFLLLLAGAALDAPVLARLFESPDPEWLAWLQQRSAYHFLARAPSQYWCDLAWRASVVLLAAQMVDGPARRFCHALLAACAAAILVSLVFSELWPNLLVLQVQPWRIGWILAIVAPALFPFLVFRLWNESVERRLALLLLVLGFALRDAGPAAFLPLSGAFFFAHARTRVADSGMALATVAVFTALAYALFTGLPVLLYLQSMHAAPVGMEWQWGPLWALRPLFIPGGLLVAILLVRARKPGMASTAALAFGAVWLAGLAHDDRPQIDREIEAGRAMPELRAALPPGEGAVLWLRGGKETWYILQRPNWAAAVQGSSIVFSRELAMRWGERVRFLVANGLEPTALATYQPMSGTPVQIGEEEVARLCARADAPLAIVAGLRAGDPAPAQTKIVSVAAAPFALHADDIISWTRADRFAIWSCSP